ncbi:MAG TPA: DUF5808 domain-containing protein [Thermomicrobiales bacterium]|nr:DUF5808 domain-containing protein [Thermomicrobiales bacterium]
MKLLWRLVQLALLWVAFQAIREQLSRPPEERTWHGRVGPVPYDFRPPDWERLRAAYWNPDSDRLFTDRVLGIGWAINVAHLLRIARELREQGGELLA